MLPWILSFVYSFSLFLEVRVQFSNQQEISTSVSISTHFIMFDITQLVCFFKKVPIAPEIGYVTCDTYCHNKYSYFIEQFGNQYLKSANLVDNHILFPKSVGNFHTILYHPQRMIHFSVFKLYAHILHFSARNTISVEYIITVCNSEINF